MTVILRTGDVYTKTPDENPRPGWGRQCRSSMNNPSTRATLLASGGRGPEIDPRRLLRCVRTSARASLNVAANPWILFTLCLLATIASVEAQAVAAPVILINRNSGQCVTIPNGSSQPGLQMVQLPCRGPLDEQWTLQAVSGGYYQIVSRLQWPVPGGRRRIPGRQCRGPAVDLHKQPKQELEEEGERQLVSACREAQRQVHGHQRRLTGRWGRGGPDRMLPLTRGGRSRRHRCRRSGAQR